MATDVNSNLPDGDEGKARKSFKLSPEEEKVLQDLSSEAYWNRAMPLSAGAMVGSMGLHRAGYLKLHPRFGALPKTAIIGFAGYIIGKLSYIPVMQDEILKRIPNSELALQIRKNRRMPALEDQTADQWVPAGRVRAPHHDDGMDNRFNDTEAPPAGLGEGGERRGITYDDLRKRHREQQQQPSQGGEASKPSYKDSPWMPQQPFPPPNPDMFADPNKEPELAPPPPAAPLDPPPRRKRTNMWGDPIDD